MARGSRAGPPGDGCPPETGGAGYDHRAPPFARMCKRCSLLTELRRDRAEVSYFNGGSAAISTGWPPPMPWWRGCCCNLLKLNYWEESHA
jgi:hypothetical protein